MTKITFKLLNGGSQEVDACDGQSFMRVAVDNDVPGVTGECGGEVSCATCHMYLSPEVSSGIGDPSDEELDLMEIMDSFVPDRSRLGCQLVVQSELDGVEVEVAPTL
ncbi:MULTISPECIES: 2Fe-2S iron-sulfur cluster-binding protein [Paenarthrobacter]|uniref:2Fe-2S iron-sulfur cluster binding domain-containing protein n=1 Tax=Paenarthrobacter aromaticivorans TaxID=2849150 RepID=A0ABS6I9Z1_9MICC|nr:2Fe-2S iron-sulfur cluster-binding protein [Paenarthrobacter sp. MMS21-TAE1-1]MBU8868541.1 2Fe-2S iron-sulfur cluster binding domain-containing protein [Paenarthrobacter sp. MMS21-TAE1-1]